MSTINPRISSFFAAIFFRFPRKCSPGGLSKPLRDVRRRPSEAHPPPLMRFLAPISTAISTAMPSSTPFPQTGPSSASRPSRHFETNSLPVRLYSHGRSGRKGRVLPGWDHAEPATYRAPVSSRLLRKNFPPEFWGQTRYDTCNSTLCGPRHDPRDFLFSEEGRPIF